MPTSEPDKLVNILKRLVAFKTVDSNPEAIEACFNYLENYLSKYPLKLKRYAYRDRPALMVTTKRNRAVKLMLQAHLDVVPAAAELFKLREKGGRLYGRGVFDMKFAAACYLKLISDLGSELPKYNFGIMFTADEELGGEHSVGYLLKKGYVADVCLLPDGGNNWQIEATRNDIWLARLIASGESAHGSRPWEGQNAINNLVEGLSEIHSLFGDQRPFKSSITISQIEGGRAVNQVPDYAAATLDMRFIDALDYDSYKQAIELIASTRGLEIETIELLQSTSVDLNQPEIVKYLDVARDFHKTPIKETHSFGSSDAHYFSALDIPVIVTRPSGDGGHSDREWINKQEFSRFYELIRAYVERVAK